MTPWPELARLTSDALTALEGVADRLPPASLLRTSDPAARDRAAAMEAVRVTGVLRDRLTARATATLETTP